MKDGNTAKSIRNNNGFVLHRFGRDTAYLFAISDGKRIWVDRSNPTKLFQKKSETWSVYLLDYSHSEKEAIASGFKTHGDAEKWAIENIK